MAKPMENLQILVAQAEFALKLLREVSKGNENESVVVSPISAAIALAMAYTGAKGQTAKEISQVLAKGAQKPEVHYYFGKLLKMMNDKEKQYTLEMANKLYMKSGLELLDEFKTAINSHYGGQFESVEFEQNVETAKKINYFVEQTTHEKIRDLVQPEMFNGQTRLVLVNAIYFKGKWAEKFDEKDTKKKSFCISEDKQEEIDMMHNTEYFIYHENDNLQILGIVYEGGDVIYEGEDERYVGMLMYLVLPKKRFGLSEVLANMTGASLLELVKKRDWKKVEVMLPKFKLESTHDLNDPLGKLGMPEAFGHNANFSGMTEKEPLKISKVIQKAFIEINEEGTEAAAATETVHEYNLCFPPPSPPPRIFHADHPFALFLADGSGTVFFGAIFRGKCENEDARRRTNI